MEYGIENGMSWESGGVSRSGEIFERKELGVNIMWMMNFKQDDSLLHFSVTVRDFYVLGRDSRIISIVSDSLRICMIRE